MTAARHSGYADPSYARAVAESEPWLLPASGGSLVMRPIDGTGFSDLAGAYPLFACEDWTQLDADLAGLDRVAVSVTAVLDPLAEPTDGLFEATFCDWLRPFKQQVVVDLTAGSPLVQASRHHRRNARRALGLLTVERCAKTPERCDEWLSLYAALIHRHHAGGGPSDFSVVSLRDQWDLPSVVVYRACLDGTTVGMALWMLQGDDAYYHLGAWDDDGYSAGAAFAIFATALDEFSCDGLRRACLGGSAGPVDDPGSGLFRFKAGWSPGRARSYVAGRVLDADAFRSLVPPCGHAAFTFFPPYRSAPRPGSGA